MKCSHLDTWIIEPHEKANACVIWMHGLGAHARDFEDIVPQLMLKPSIAMRFIFPNAPIRPVTINQGIPMPAWYDIYDLTCLDKQDNDGIKTSKQAIVELIKQQVNSGILSQRIILAGFSQGGAMALYTGLRYEKRLAGIMALSCYLPLSDQLADEHHAANNHLPIFMAHGRDDMTVLMLLAEISCTQLRKAGYSIQWHDYSMEHQLCTQEIADIATWINQVL